MCCEASVLHGQVIVLLFVHLFVDDVLLSDAQRTAGSPFVDLRGSAGRFDAGFEAAVAAS